MVDNRRIPGQSNVFLRSDIAAILDALEMAANGQPVPINAVRKALHIQPSGDQFPRIVQGAHYQLRDSG